MTWLMLPSSLTAAASRLSSTSAKTMFQPRSASPRPVANPIPLAPPVITATFGDVMLLPSRLSATRPDAWISYPAGLIAQLMYAGIRREQAPRHRTRAHPRAPAWRAHMRISDGRHTGTVHPSDGTWENDRHGTLGQG